MLRRTFIALTGLVLAARKRLRGQSRSELARMLVEQLQSTSFRSSRIMEMGSPELVRILGDGSSSEFAKAKACQRLAVVGEESAVPAVARLLADSKLSHYARTALEAMPGDAADKALREALGTLEGGQLVGVINSIGVRRDPEALMALAALRHGDDSDVAAAATWAIGRIRRP